MKLFRSVMVGSMLVFLMSAMAASGWADDWHGREGDDNRGGAYMHGHDRGGDYHGYERGDGRDWGDDDFHRDEDRGWQSGFVLDREYHHNRYYPPRGYFERGLPPDYMTFDYGNERYYYSSGIWYNDTDFGYVVVMPPYGIVVPVLPPYYSTIWVGGVPYYYADNVYYVWQPAQQGYVVSAPPATSNAVTQAQNSDQLYVYPEKGQSAKLQAKDRYECHHWAVGQTGFDPSQPAGDPSGSQLVTKRDDYRRAIEACLDARGYSVK
jgi:Family of unknown function (DUF6515)